MSFEGKSWGQSARGIVCGRVQHSVADADDPEVWHPPFFAPDFWTDGWAVWGVLGSKVRKPTTASGIHGATGGLTRYQGYGNDQFHPKNTKRDFSGTTK